MNQILVIARITIKEMIRDKIIYLFALFFLLSLILSGLLSNLVVLEVYRVIFDFTLAGFSFFGELLAIFLGVSLVFNEIEKKTVYTTLVKPISRYQFIIGKFLGLSIVLSLLSILFGIVTIVNCIRLDFSIFTGLLQCVFLHYIEMIVLMSLGMALSTITKPLLGLFSALTLFAFGHFVSNLLVFMDNLRELSFLEPLLKVLVYVFDLEVFNIRNEVIYSNIIQMSEILNRLFYGISLSAAFILVAIFFFSRREF